MNYSKDGRTEEIKWWQAALMIRGQTAADQRNIRIFTAWCFAWAVSFCVVAIALKEFPALQGPFGWMLAIIPIVLGVAAIRTFLRFLREADEFTRKVQIEGIAWGFGMGHLFCIGYFFLEQLGAPEISIVNAIVPMALGWAVGSLLVASRYR
jgi:uncharacterized protein YacL